MEQRIAERLEARLVRQAPLPPATGPSAGALRERLERLLLDVEDEIGGDILTSILLVDRDGKRLLHGAGPSLPPSYNQAIDGVEIGPNVGSCGTAAYLGHPVYVVDIALSPLWADFRDLAAEHGLRACWSTPIENDHGRIVGTFAVYHRTPRGPTPDEVEAIGLVSRVAAKAIERHLPHGASPP